MSPDQVPRRTLSSATVLGGVTSCLLLGAAVVHLLQISEEFEYDPIYGWFFVALTVSQAAAAGALILWRRRSYLYVATGNLGVIAIWILTRTTGVPFGAEPWSPQAVGRSDLVATFLELASVLAIVYLLSPFADGARMAYPLALALGLTGVTVSGAAVSASVLGARGACSHFNPEFGPFGTVDGHSILPREYPQARLRAGETRSLLSGQLVNCGSDEARVTAVEVVSESGGTAQVLETSALPLKRDGEPTVYEGLDVGGVAVPPTNDRPDLGLFSRVRGISAGFYSINGLRIRYRYRGRSLAQEFATNVAIVVSGGP